MGVTIPAIYQYTRKLTGIGERPITPGIIANHDRVFGGNLLGDILPHFTVGFAPRRAAALRRKNVIHVDGDSKRLRDLRSLIVVRHDINALSGGFHALKDRAGV